MTWGRKTGGRKKGTPNKIKKLPALMVEAQAEVAAAVSANEGLQPLDCMLQVMRDPTASEVRPHFSLFAIFVYSRDASRRRKAGSPIRSNLSFRHAQASGSARLLSAGLWRRRSTTAPVSFQPAATLLQTESSRQSTTTDEK